MNVRLDDAVTQTQRKLETAFHDQNKAFLANPYPQANERIKNLAALKKQIHRYQDLLADAMSQDFGFRSSSESKMLDVLASTLEINHAKKHLKKWMKPQRRSTELLFLSNSLKVTYQPKGVVGVIVPWNFPLYLAIGPLAAALAAGNRVMIKMPESTPATNAVLRRLLAEVFAEDLVAVFGEEVEDPNAFTSLPFNHIVFTGSPTVGKIVMRTAAESLTPVTLELGGKSPALVLEDVSVREAAGKIAHGKGTNCGQICVSPDYALVPKAKVDEFASEVQLAFASMYGGATTGNEHYTALINDRHHSRIKALLDDAREKGAKITPCAPVGDNRQMPLHVVTNVSADMRLMQEEIFGPILPVVPYEGLDEALNHINSGPRPLALYMFGHDTETRDQILKRTHSGGVTINDWGWHVMNHDAPFGGVGNSGMGTYHGIEGFRELSHAKTVFTENRLFPIKLFYPPYGNVVQHLILKVFIGSGDDKLK